MKKRIYWILGIVVLLVFTLTNPSQKDFKEYLGSTTYHGLRRTSNYLVCSVYDDGDKYFGVLDNFFSIKPKVWQPPAGDIMVDSAKLADTSKLLGATTSVDQLPDMPVPADTSKLLDPTTLPPPPPKKVDEYGIPISRDKANLRIEREADSLNIDTVGYTDAGLPILKRIKDPLHILNVHQLRKNQSLNTTIMTETMWGAITALGTWALVLVTIYLVKKQTEISRTDLKVRLQNDFEEKFDSSNFLSERIKLAGQLLTDTPHKDINEPIMNFFESIGIMLRRGYLDKELVWGGFSYYAFRWWSATKDYILEERKLKNNDSTIFEDFEFLVNELYDFEVKRRKITRAQIELSASELRDFLEEEKAL